MITNYIHNKGLDRYSYSEVNLGSKKPKSVVVNGSYSQNIVIRYMGVEYFEIKGNGSEVLLEIEGMNQGTGVVIYRD